MKKQCVEQQLLGDAIPSLPKLYLVKDAGKGGSNLGVSQPEEISELVGLPYPKEIEASPSETANPEISPEHRQAIEDVDLLNAGLITRTELRKRYLKTYKNWDDMKQRCKADPETGMRPIALDASFENFPDFLKIVGPRPEPSWSLDRIDHTGPYSPSNVRWASKETQSRNRSNTVYLTAREKTKPLVVWAEELGTNPDTLRRRKRDGWTDEEIIEGTRSWTKHSPSQPVTSQKHWDYTPWQPGNREAMERLYQRYGWREENRLRFAKRYPMDRLSRIKEEIFMCWWPDDHTPSEAECSKLEELTRQHEMWEAIYRYNHGRCSDENRSQLYYRRELPEWVEKKLRTSV